MPVYITDTHLKAGETRQTYSDGGPKGQKGFVLRTTPNGVFTFYYQYLNKKTGKREWELIGQYPEWSIARARSEATRLAGLVAGDKDIKQIRLQKRAVDRAQGRTFREVHDLYIDYCKEPILRRWGTVPRKETWRGMKYALRRPLEWWGDKTIGEITEAMVDDLYQSIITEGYPAQANNVRGQLGTLFNWAINKKGEKFAITTPCTKLSKDDTAIERADVEDGRVLTADEIRTLWFGLDDPKCPGNRLSRLALKLSLVTVLRTGECVKIERGLVTPESVTIPLHAVKSRRADKSRPVTQPLNSLAREIIGEVFSIGDPERHYAFPGTGPRKGSHMKQHTLGRLLARTTEDHAGQMGVCEFLGLDDVTPHDLRRTAACILEQLGYDDATIGKVMTHKTMDKEAASVTRERYLVPVKIIARPVDPRVKALDDLDAALREILGLTPAQALPVPQKLLTAA
jgi:integrase